MYDGVLKYRWGTVTTRVPIPADRLTCQMCPRIIKDKALDRATCGENFEVLPNWTKQIDDNCPIVWDNEEQEIIEIKESEIMPL